MKKRIVWLAPALVAGLVFLTATMGSLGVLAQSTEVLHDGISVGGPFVTPIEENIVRLSLHDRDTGNDVRQVTYGVLENFGGLFFTPVEVYNAGLSDTTKLDAEFGKSIFTPDNHELRFWDQYEDTNTYWPHFRLIYGGIEVSNLELRNPTIPSGEHRFIECAYGSASNVFFCSWAYYDPILEDWDIWGAVLNAQNLNVVWTQWLLALPNRQDYPQVQVKDGNAFASVLFTSRRTTLAEGCEPARSGQPCGDLKLLHVVLVDGSIGLSATLRDGGLNGLYDHVDLAHNELSFDGLAVHHWFWGEAPDGSQDVGVAQVYGWESQSLIGYSFSPNPLALSTGHNEFSALGKTEENVGGFLLCSSSTTLRVTCQWASPQLQATSAVFTPTLSGRNPEISPLNQREMVVVWSSGDNSQAQGQVFRDPLVVNNISISGPATTTLTTKVDYNVICLDGRGIGMATCPVVWSASAGQITQNGFYSPTLTGTVTLTTTWGDRLVTKTVQVISVASPQPAVYLPIILKNNP